MCTTPASPLSAEGQQSPGNVGEGKGWERGLGGTQPPKWGTTSPGHTPPWPAHFTRVNREIICMSHIKPQCSGTGGWLFQSKSLHLLGHGRFRDSEPCEPEGARRGWMQHLSDQTVLSTSKTRAGVSVQLFSSTRIC